MLLNELKARSCKLSTCRKSFSPKAKWQEFCSTPCRNTASNHRRARRIKKYKKIAEQVMAQKAVGQ